jgi:hypothetical protein
MITNIAKNEKRNKSRLISAHIGSPALCRIIAISD